MKLEIISDLPSDRLAEMTALLREQLPKAAALLERSPELLEINIVDDAAMSAMHERFLGIDGPTDVLTFELDHDADGRVSEGAIAVCLDEAARQAATRSHDTATELLLYAVHGLLHLVGYDDQDPNDYAAMHAAEDKILIVLGIGRVFGD